MGSGAAQVVVPPDQDLIPTETTGAEVDYSKPIVLTLQNDTPVDISPFLVVQENISPEDVTRLLNTTLYAHTQQSFTLNRTGYPAHIDIIFRVAYTEKGYRGYTIARWEYIEADVKSDACHRAEGTKPYFVGCTGSDAITVPTVDFTIGYQELPRAVSRYPLPSP